MYKVKAIYDGNSFKFEKSLPFNEKYEVEIIFKKPIKRSQQKILEYFNSWDKKDLEPIEEIINERKNFSLNRKELWYFSILILYLTISQEMLK